LSCGARFPARIQKDLSQRNNHHVYGRDSQRPLQGLQYLPDHWFLKRVIHIFKDLYENKYPNPSLNVEATELLSTVDALQKLLDDRGTTQLDNGIVSVTEECIQTAEQLKSKPRQRPGQS
jgi:hypothetical protein